MLNQITELAEGEVETAFTFIVTLLVLGYVASSSVVENKAFINDLMNQLIGIYGLLGVGAIVALFLIITNKLQNF
ncbi:MAG: hypothetical protein ABEJ98_05690 [Candidatus Nanohaloarchaea archaeon]